MTGAELYYAMKMSDVPFAELSIEEKFKFEVLAETVDEVLAEAEEKNDKNHSEQNK